MLLDLPQVADVANVVPLPVLVHVLVVHGPAAERCDLVERLHNTHRVRPSAAEVYNIGGGRANSVSIMEAFDKVAALSGRPMHYEYVDQNREGDHICYISDLRKIEQHYSDWRITKTLDDTFLEIVEALQQRLAR